MLSTLKNSWKVPEIRKKLLFTIFMIIIFRLGAAIPVPGIDREVIEQIFKSSETGGLLGFLNLMSGGGFKDVSVFALSIYPYITASIIIQLLAVAIPSLESLSKEGEIGKKKMNKYTRYLTVVLAVVNGLGTALGLFNKAIINKSALTVATIVLIFTAGTCFLIWLGGQITEKGVGNGVSIIIFVGIISSLPDTVINIAGSVKSGKVNIINVIGMLVIALFILIGVIMIQEGQRKIPVQYAKRVVGRKMYGGQSTYIPLKVLMAGVIPVIFASSILQFPQILSLFFTGGFKTFITKYLTLGSTTGTWIYSILNILLILFFTFFYTAVQFNPIEYANNLKQSGGFVPGIRPGKPTSDYLGNILSKITFLGAIALSILATLPVVLDGIFKLGIQFGGTAILIVVGVVLETMRNVESQMLSRNYKGFLK